MTVWPNGSKTIPTVTDEFGWREVHPVTGVRAFHYGIDLIGFPINCSPCDGVVIYASYNGGAGNEVRVRAANGDVFRIKHNASFMVSVGQNVREGQGVGVMGTTGASTGVHCHFECWPGNTEAVNPRDYMARAIASNPAGGGGTSITQGEEDMTYAIRNSVRTGALPGLPEGAILIGNGTDPLVWVSNFGPEQSSGVTLSQWSDKQIAERISQVGLRGSGKDIDKVFSSLADAQAKPPRPAYTL